MKSIFSSPVDKYFVGKIVFGLIFIFSLCNILLSVLAIAGTYQPVQGYIAKSAVWALVFSSVTALVGFIGFYVVEKRRKKHLNSESIK